MLADTDGNFIFGLHPPVNNILTSLHPSTVHIFQLWQAFLNHVNPITKLFHAPTVQQQLLTAAADLTNVSKSMEVLMFAIYSSSVSSLSNEECLQMFGESKQILSARYQLGAQRALVNARFLKTTDLVVLQAYLLFLVSLIKIKFVIYLVALIISTPSLSYPSAPTTITQHSGRSLVSPYAWHNAWASIVMAILLVLNPSTVKSVVEFGGPSLFLTLVSQNYPAWARQCCT
jgi:hypothetical protein